MTRVLVFGSSHVAAIVLGWPRVQPEFPSVSLDFLAAQQPVIDCMRRGKGDLFGLLAPGEIDPRRVALVDQMSVARTVHLDDYDHLLRVGANIGVAAIQDLLTGFIVDGLREIDPPSPVPRLSAALFRALCADVVQATLAENRFERFHGSRVTVLPRPRLSELSADQGDDHVNLARSLREMPQGVRAALDVFEDICAETLAGKGLQYCRQPSETVGSFGFTRQEFSRGNVSMRADRPDMRATDLHHMNPDYGAICLRAALRLVLAAGSGQSEAQVRTG